jgi:transaldolase
VGTQLKELIDAGQSIWLDNIRRSMFDSGELRRLIAGGLRGMTSNPTIFEKAIGSGNDYDAQLAGLVGSEHDRRHPARLRRISSAVRRHARR